MSRGVWNAIGAYLLWGILPIYWKALSHVPALQILSHRVVWSLVFLALVVALRKEWSSLLREARKPRILGIYIFTGLLIGVNWLTYIWAVNAGHIVETSLGYFINPLISVLFGSIFLREKLRLTQWIPIAMAGAAVIYLTLGYGTLPWIALTLAVTFALYGLLKKITPLGSLHGLTMETGVLLIPCLAYLLCAESNGVGAFGHAGWVSDSLLLGTGIFTALPLLMFANAARSIPLWSIGLLQYIAPTMQFLIGVLIYGEAFTLARAVGFVIIWSALFFFWLEGFLWRRQDRSNDK